MLKIDKENVARTHQENQAKFTQGEELTEKGMQKTSDYLKKLKEKEEQLKGLKSGADALAPVKGGLNPALQGITMDPMQTAGSMVTPVPGANLGTPLNMPQPVDPFGMSSFQPPAPVTGVVDAATTGIDATTKTVDAVDKSKSVLEQTGAAKGGIGAAIKAWKAQKAANQAIKAGTAVGQTTSAAGAGWGAMSSGAKGNVIGAAATLAGEGIKKWGGDDDDTDLNTAEWSGELLSGAGTGIGVATGAATIASMMGAGALWGSAVPGLGTAIGAVAGLGYGAWKALSGRKKARAAEAEMLAKKTERVGKYNKSVRNNLLTSTAQARAGELEQKTYSGYDLGRNVVAKYGGERYKNGGMKMGTPRYGDAA